MPTASIRASCARSTSRASNSCSRRGRRPNRSPSTDDSRRCATSTCCRGRCNGRTRRCGSPVVDRSRRGTSARRTTSSMPPSRTTATSWPRRRSAGTGVRSRPTAGTRTRIGWRSCSSSASPTPIRRPTGSTASRPSTSSTVRCTSIPATPTRPATSPRRRRGRAISRRCAPSSERNRPSTIWRGTRWSRRVTW